MFFSYACLFSNVHKINSTETRFCGNVFEVVQYKLAARVLSGLNHSPSACSFIKHYLNNYAPIHVKDFDNVIFVISYR